MIDASHIPQNPPGLEVFEFIGTTPAAQTLFSWTKPRGKSMVRIFLLGPGGNGSAGVIGANSTAAGGGGGGSGSQSQLLIPAWLLPDTLFITLSGPGNSASNAIVHLYAGINTVNSIFLAALSGTNSTAASGATPGTGGAAASAASASNCNLATLGIASFLAGQAGASGSAAAAGNSVTLPTTGLMVSGGAGAGGLPAAAAIGSNGGAIQATAQTQWLSTTAASGPSAATTPPQSGVSMWKQQGVGLFMPMFMGGCGGASTHGSATGAGLAQSSGGDGGPGSGGGGSGGALTGSTAGVAGKGGPAYCLIMCW